MKLPRLLIFLLFFICNQYFLVSAEEELLFRPRKGVEFHVRLNVPLLNVKYSLFRTALTRLVLDWLEGDIGKGQPQDQWEKSYIAKVNGEVNGNGNYCFEKRLDTQIKDIYNEMIKIKVSGHLKVTTSHRRWIRLTFKFLQIIGVKFSSRMVDLVGRHDLSKYTHREVLGYAVKFGDGSGSGRKLKTEAEKLEWNNTLFNHYAGNPHHPEYFYPLESDGTRNKKTPVVKLDPENGKNFLDEGIIDMLAARGERTLANDAKFNVKKWFDIDETYLSRYGVVDKQYVLACLENYKTKAGIFFSTYSNVKNIQGIFGDRNVVYKYYST